MKAAVTPEKDDMVSLGSPKVSIVIGCYRPSIRLQTCLDSIMKSSFKNLEIILVTNEPLPTSVSQADPRLKVTVMRLGSVAAKIFGASRAVADLIVFLDDDTIVEEGWLDSLMSVFENDQTVGVAQPKLVRTDNRTFDTAGGQLDRYGFYDERGAGKVDVGQFDNYCKVFWSSGSAMAIRRLVFWRAGGFDLNDWSGIDIDLCWRVRLMGYSVVYVPDSKVLHHKSSTVRKLLLCGLKFGYTSAEVERIRQIEVGWFFMCTGQLALLIRNYSTPNVVKRLAVALGTWWLSGLFFILAGKPTLGILRLSVTLRSAATLILNIKAIHKRRQLVQNCVRRVKDKAVEEAMVPPLSTITRPAIRSHSSGS